MLSLSTIFARKKNLSKDQPSRWVGANLLVSFIILFGSLVFWFLPAPDGLSTDAWHLFIIFLATISAIILKPLPMGAVSVLGLSACLFTQTLTIDQSLTSFNSPTVWLVLCAFFIARGFVKTGLGARIAYFFMTLLGRSSLGLSYGMVLTDFILSPVIPSNTARGGGITYPIVQSLANEYGSSPKTNSSHKIGAFLVQVAFQANLVTSAMFLTAFAGNPLAVKIAADVGIVLDWGTWAISAIVPGIIHLALLPLAVYLFCPPTLKKTPEAPGLAREKLKEMGPLSTHEILMLFVFALLLVLWIFGSTFGIAAAGAALIGLALLLFTGVLSWEDVLHEKAAWDTFLWLSILLTLATQLGDFGIIKWFGVGIQEVVQTLSMPLAVGALCLLYFYCHYFFASGTAHITSLFAVFLIALVSTGFSPLVSVLVLSYFSSLSSGLTHYGTGAAPVFFGGNFLTVRQWWSVGLKMSVVTILVWGFAGGVWWKILGYW